MIAGDTLINLVNLETHRNAFTRFLEKQPQRPFRLVSLIIPVFNEETVVEACYQALCILIQGLEHWYEFEFVFTDNHSTDQTFSLLKNLSQQDNRIRVLSFSRNYGYQKSIYTGYQYARGEAVIQMDADLQDPPEMLYTFLEYWESGYQVVYGVREQRQENWIINTTRKLFYRLINWLSEDYLPPDAGDFRLLDAAVVQDLMRWPSSRYYIRGAIAALGYNQKGVAYRRRPRTMGHSKFSLADYCRLAFDGILSHSVIPLRLATYTGWAVTVLSFFLVVLCIIGRIWFGANWPMGFATTTLLILASLGLNALFLGIIGEYTGRIYCHLTRQPNVSIQHSAGFHEPVALPDQPNGYSVNRVAG